ncbi:MAG: inorganic phosphate transporter [Candidatus Hodarchaeota archaeon]
MEPLIIITLVFTIAFAFGIGSNDETMATTVGTGGLRLKYAVILAAILATVGALFLSAGVAKSIGTGLLNSDSIDLIKYQGWIMLSVLIAVSAWLILASKIGAPVSGTHSVVGAIFGVGFCSPLLGSDFLSAIKWSGLTKVVLGWILSPILGLGCSLVISLLVKYLVRRRIKGLDGMENVERIMLIALVCLVSLNQVNRAGNDAGNALGVFYALFDTGEINSPMLNTMLFIGSASIGLGLFIVGRSLLKSVGKNIIEIRPSDAICIESSVLIVLILSNTFGFPISGSHVLIFAIIGLALIKGEKVDKKSLKKIALSWGITFPVAAVFCAGILSLLLVLTGL